ncbi:unnamed protein product, partial [Allacma fusca]
NEENTIGNYQLRRGVQLDEADQNEEVD